MSDSEQFQVTEEYGVAVLTMNRPESRNAVGTDLREAMIDTLEGIGVDQSIRAIVLTGEGSAFSAGGDIAAMKKRLERDPGAVAAEGWLHQRRNTHRLITLLATMEKPVIAAVNGAAAGLGADLAMACDRVIASERAKFAYSYILRGLIPDGGGMFFLPRRVGMACAKELIFTGRTVLAEEALEIGLIDELVAHEDLRAIAVERARQFGSGSPVALGLAKSILSASHESSLDDILNAGAAAQGICYGSQEHRASVTAFFER